MFASRVRRLWDRQEQLLSIEQEGNMPLSISMIALSSQLVVAVADRVPTFDINRSCKLDAAAATGLTLDQSVKSCVDDENRARQELTSQWSSFPAAGKANCIPQESIGGTPSYVSLLTCLQMGTWAR
ncbi:hypothetical protein CQ14_05830 [Bradyrhizobium lablabi]|uniref:Uncharacterized protein n=2 Tax=Bradyrhizobium lablabi TaxID=722472 RepID=A0A0R3MXT8_9BRAD|nr:hypothetical protein CQ14_05830 [Bradyrhizobium lablabi]